MVASELKHVFQTHFQGNKQKWSYLPYIEMFLQRF